MSPEQSLGLPVDKRTDIWAFGCVLYEMLTGEQAFRGDGLADVIEAVLNREPHWERLPAGTPTTVQHLIQRCLQKDSHERLRDIGEARIALQVAIKARTSVGSGSVSGRTDRGRSSIDMENHGYGDCRGVCLVSESGVLGESRPGCTGAPWTAASAYGRPRMAG